MGRGEATTPRWVKAALRLAVGGAVFGVLLARTDVGTLGRRIGDTSPGYLVAAVALFFAGLGVSALRWREYLVALEYPMPYATLYRLYFVGTFFNAFLPTGVGGDAYKAVRIGKARGQTARAFAGVFLDRFAGLVGLALIGVALASARIASGDREWVPWVAALAAAGILGSAAALLGFGERLLGGGRLVKATGLGGKVRQMVRGIHDAGRHPRAAAAGLALGVASQAIMLAIHMLLARALGLDVPVATMGAVLVVVSVAVLLPISVSGLGVVEFVYAQALHAYGVPRASAVAFALLVRAVSLVSSAAGGVVYLVFGGEVGAPPDSR